MSLLARLMSLLGTGAVRGGLLLLALFAAHLLITRALPEVQATLEALERKPEVEKRLGALQQQLLRDTADLGQLKNKLQSLVSQRLVELQQAQNDWQVELEELKDKQADLESRMQRLKARQKEYCSSLNPLKRWMCARIRSEVEDLLGALEPAITSTQASITGCQNTLTAIGKQLEIVRSDTLSDAEKLKALGGESTGSLGLELLATRQRLDGTRAKLTQVRSELLTLSQHQDSIWGWLLKEWKQVYLRLLGIVAVVLGLPYLQRVLSYFVFMPVFSKLAKPIHLRTREHATLDAGESLRALTLELKPGEELMVRAEYARPVQGKASSQLLYNWKAPLVSYAAGLRVLTRLSGDNGTKVSVAPPDPDVYVRRIELREHPGLVVHPRHVVGVLGDIRLETAWRIFSWHAWATWQLRYILFCGSGSVLLQGLGELAELTPGSSPAKIEQPLVVAYDSRLLYSTRRTETFLPYLLGRAELVDDCFQGPHSFFWQKSKPRPSTNYFTRSFDALFSALGKFLGF